MKKKKETEKVNEGSFWNVNAQTRCFHRLRVPYAKVNRSPLPFCNTSLSFSQEKGWITFKMFHNKNEMGLFSRTGASYRFTYECQRFLWSRFRGAKNNGPVYLQIALFLIGISLHKQRKDLNILFRVRNTRVFFTLFWSLLFFGSSGPWMLRLIFNRCILKECLA